MEISYTIDEAAFSDFNLYHVKNSKSAQKSLNLQRFLGPVLFLLIPIIFSDLLELPFIGIFIPFLLISILWLIFYPAYFYRFVNKAAQKMIKEGKNEGIFGEHTMQFTEEGLLETSRAGESKVYWGNIEQLGEDANNFYLYNSAISAFIIPKKDLSDISEVRTYLGRKIESPKAEKAVNSF